MPTQRRSTPASVSTHTGVLIERSSAVLTFTLNDPDHQNHVTGAMFDAMLAALRAEARRPSARILRIRARGAVFCTGRERAGRNRREVRHESARLIAFKRALRTSPLISVTEVQGDALGFGFGLAIVSDFVLVAEHAALGFPEMRSGLAPAAIMAYLGEYTLPRWAFPPVLLGDTIDPRRALEIGLVSHVFPPERLAPEADALVARILSLDPAAVRRCKEFFLTTQQNSFDRNCRLATAALTAGSMAVLARKK
jgi:methylglutaconyl-CoA hydratase